MDIDIILKEIGQFGKYQLQIFILLLLCTIFTTFFSISFVFTASDLQYRCHIPECEDSVDTDYNPTWLRNAVPFPSNKYPSKCTRYLTTNYSTLNSCSENIFNRHETEICSKFVFETNEITIANEFNSLCDENKWKLAAVGTVNNIGQFFGMTLTGIYSDKFGRKNLLITSVLLSTFCGIARSLSPSYMIFLFFEMIDALISSGCYGAAFLIGIELFPPEKRVLISTILACSYTVGEVTLGLVAWVLQDWRLYLRALYIPGLLFITYIWLLPESLRWLIANKKYEEAKKVITRIGAVNGKPIPNSWFQKFDLYQSEDSKNKKAISSYSPENKESENLKEILHSKIMLSRLINCSFCWATCAFVFYGLSLHSVSIGGNKYLNFIMASLAEIPGYIITLVVLLKMGRRSAVFLFLSLTGLACFSFFFIPEDVLLIKLMVYLIGKCAITAAFSVLYIFSSEIFPTTLRHSLMGTCSTIGRIGSIAAPQMPLLAKYINPVVIFGTFSLAAGLLGLLFPETKNSKLPDTIEEAENIDTEDAILLVKALGQFFQ